MTDPDYLSFVSPSNLLSETEIAQALRIDVASVPSVDGLDFVMVAGQRRYDPRELRRFIDAAPKSSATPRSTATTLALINQARGELEAEAVAAGRPRSSVRAYDVHERARAIGSGSSTPPAAPAAPPPPPRASVPVPPPKKAVTMPKKNPTTIADFHRELAEAERDLGLSAGSTIDLKARAERVRLAAERVIDPAKAKREAQRADIAKAMGVARPPSGPVTDAATGRTYFHPTTR